jgi:S1-C subfamily serine protease
MPLVLVGLALTLLAGVAAFAYGGRSDRATVEKTADSRRLDAVARQVKKLEEQVAALAARPAPAPEKPDQRPSVSAVADRVLRSVFTIETPASSGSAWAAWTAGGSQYLVTAHHVVDGYSSVKVLRKTSSWDGVVVREDEVNDLALVRVRKKIAPSLWQTDVTDRVPGVGEQLILLGSPYGLEGSVTTGIVSRITYNAIQTDAAANPGNSGGPAVNLGGDVVGVLLAGGGQNVNFAVPTSRLCVSTRRCD